MSRSPQPASSARSFQCVLMGGEALLVQCADHLHQQGHCIDAVVSRDKQVAAWCAEHDIRRLDPDGYEAEVKALAFDYFFSIANLRVVPPSVLEQADRAAINFHDGPLPDYAGLNTPTWAIINQESSHAVTWHVMTEGVDKGGILASQQVPIHPDETALTLNTKCFEAGLDTFKTLLDDLEKGTASPRPQDTARRTYYGRHQPPPNDGVINWSWQADRIDALVRALSFGTYKNPLGAPKCFIDSTSYRVDALHVLPSDSEREPGTVVEAEADRIVVATGSKDVAITGLSSLVGESAPISDVQEQHDVAVGTRWHVISLEEETQFTEQGESLSRHEPFWVEALQRVQAADLPYPRSAVHDSDGHGASGGETRVSVATLTLKGIPSLAQAVFGDEVYDKERGGWNKRGRTLCSAILVYLARLTRRETLSLGYLARAEASDGAARDRNGARIHSLAARTVPLTVDIDRREAIGEALQDIGRALERLHERETYRSDVFVRYPALQRQHSQGPPRFDVVLSERSEFDMGSVGEDTAEDLPHGARLHIMVDPDGETSHWVYDESALDRRFLADMQRHLQHVLDQMDSDPSTRMNRLALLPPDEREALLVEWNGTERTYAPRGVHQFFEKQVERTPEAPAVVFHETSVTYRALNKRANKLARYLIRRGVTRGDRVGICVERSVKMVVGLLGILKAGATYVPLDPTYPAERLAFMIDDAGLEAVVSQERYHDLLDRYGGTTVLLDRDEASIHAENDAPLDVAIDPDQLAYLIYTSGSTGRPKGVMVSHQNVANFFAGMDECIQHGAAGTDQADNQADTQEVTQEVWLAVTSISFDISVLELFWTLRHGFKVILQPDPGQRAAAAVVPSSDRNMLTGRKTRSIESSAAGSEATGSEATESTITASNMAPSAGGLPPTEMASRAKSSEVESTGHVAFRGTAGQSMAFSLYYFSSDEKLDGETGAASDKYRLLLEGAKYGDEHGFQAVWTPERHFHDFGGLYPNPSVISAAIAASTDHIRIRAGSCVAPLHHPVRIAEDWAVVDNLSEGRVDISFAAGWQPDDFVLDPSAYADRKTVMFDRIKQVQALWRGGSVAFDDAKGGQTKVRTLPRPVQQDLPVWITAAGNPETFRMAGERGYNVLTHLLGQSIDELAEKIAIYRAARQEHGFDPDRGQVTLMLHAFVGEDDEVVREAVREPMKDYLRSSIGLIKKAAWSFPTFKQKTTGTEGQFTTEHLSESDMDEVLDFSFERYYETSGLFGTPERCLRLVDDLRRRGVDEIACLLDFGLDAERVLDHLPALNDVRERAQQWERFASTRETHPAAEEDMANDQQGAVQGHEASGSPSPRLMSPNTPPADYSVAAQIERHNVTHLQCTPSQARMLVADGTARAALHRLDHMMVGGEALPVELAKTLRESVSGAVTNMYGPTETTIWSTTHPVRAVGQSMPIGRPIANTQIYILDDELEPIPVGVPGQLYIGGDGVTKGYWQRPQLTAERFVENPFQQGGRMYHTGDVARYRPDGVIEFLGREDFQVKIRGHRIELGEIEATLEAQDTVQAAVVTARDGTGGPELVAYVQSKEEDRDEEALRQALAQQLPPIMVPSVMVWLDAFPLTPNGKVDRKALPEPERFRKRVAKQYVAPDDQIERVIAEIWQEVLQVDTVGVTDNFFDLGGHSLLAVRVNTRLQEALDRDISIVELFQYPSVRALADHLSRDSGSQDNGEAAGVTQGQDRAEKRREALLERRRSR